MTTPMTALMMDAYGGTGGIAQFNRHLLDALATDERLDVTALGLTGDVHALAPSGLRWSIPASGDKLRYSATVAKVGVTRRPRIVLSGHTRLAPLAHPLAALTRAAVWTTTHGIEVWRPDASLATGELSRARRPLDDALLGRSQLVTTVSRYTRSRLLAWCRIAPENVAVLPNAIDRTRYQPGPRSAELEAKLGLAGTKVLLTVARLNPDDNYKGHDRVLPLLPELERRVGKVRYLIAGSGPDRARLERCAEQAGAAEQVVFLGHVPDEELPAFYQLADVFVMPSTGEGFGIVYLEALACGCPVVAGNRDGSVDALADGELGKLVDPFDSAALLEALEATLREGRSHEEPIRGVERFDVAEFHKKVRGFIGRLLVARD